MAESITPKSLDITLHDRVPDGQWEIVDVVFPSTAGTDFQIPHSLSPETPEQIEYTVLRQAQPGTVYEDRSATRTAWSPGFIVLRSDTAGWTGRILLRVLKTPRIWTPGQNVPTSVPETILVTGASSPAAILGSYTATGTYGGKPLYTNGLGGYIWFSTAHTAWVINVTLGDSDSGCFYYNTSSAVPPATSPWLVWSPTPGQYAGTLVTAFVPSRAVFGVEQGGTGADLSILGPGFLKQASLGSVVSVAALTAADIASGQLALARGGTNADLSATGGAGQVLKQKTSGGNIAVEALVASELGTGTGSSSNWLRGDLAWTAMTYPGAKFCKVYKSADQTGIGAYALLSFDTEDSDVPGWHDNSTNNSRITLGSSDGGTYLVVLQGRGSDTVAGGGGFAKFMLRKNAAGSSSGGTLLAEVMSFGGNASVHCWQTMAWVGTLANSDYVEAFAATTQAGGSLTAVSGAAGTTLTVIKLN